MSRTRFSTAWAVVLALAASCFAAEPARAPDVPYVPTPQPVVDEMLRMADVKKDDVVYDLGCGDGRIVITAAKQFGARGLGVDIDPKRIEESQENARKAEVADKVEFRVQDLFEMQLSDATVVTLYLLPSINVKLRPKLLDELKPGTRVVSHAFDMGDWKPDRQAQAQGASIYMWIIPAKVQGVWQGKIPGADGEQDLTLNLMQEYQYVTGKIRIGGQEHAIEEGVLKGTELTFTAPGPDGKPRQYSARISDQKLEGTVAGDEKPIQFTAQRQGQQAQDR